MASTSKNLDIAPASYYHAGGQQHQQHQHHQHHHPDQHHIRMMKYEQKCLGIPPGWRFRPTDQELITEYLIKRILKRPLPMNSRIVDVNLYDCTPMDLAAKYQLPEDPIMFFFTPREKKYPNGIRPSRTTSAKDKGTGYWKATGTNYEIKCSNKGKTIGCRMTLVFYKGQHKDKENNKTDWIMQEYTIAKKKAAKKTTRVPAGDKKLDEWVLCKVYKSTRNKKKNTDSVEDDEEETKSLAASARSQAEEDQDHPLLHNSLPPSTNGINNFNPSTSNLAEQYNLMINNQSVHAVPNNGSTSGAHHQEVESTLADHQPSEYGFRAQSIYNNVSPFDNQFRLVEPVLPVPDFDFSTDDIGEFLDFDMPIEYAEPLNHEPHIDPATPSTKAEGKSTSTPTEDLN